jgi:hypothetical protein
MLNQHGFDLPLDALSVEECAEAIYRRWRKERPQIEVSAASPGIKTGRVRNPPSF